MSVQCYGYDYGRTSLFHFPLLCILFKKIVSDFGNFETLCVRKDSHRESTIFK